VNPFDVEWIDTTHDTIDLGADGVGRINFVTAAANTTLRVNLTNLYPWELGTSTSLDALYIRVPNLNIDSQLNDSDAGVTTFDITYPWQGVPLISAAAADVTTLAQYRYEIVNAPATDAGYLYAFRPERSVQVSNLEMINAFDNTISAALVATNRNKALTLNWHRSDFAALASQVNATLYGYYLDVLEIPFDATAGHGAFVVGGANVLDTVYGGAPTDVSTAAATINYAQFTPAAPVVGEVSFYFGRDYQLIGGGTMTLYGIVYTSNSISAFSGNQAVALTPPTNLTVQGMNAMTPAAVALTSTTPVVAWTAPTGAVAYYVSVVRVYNDTMMQPAQTTVAVLITDQTHVTLPAGTLASGNRYGISVRAMAEPTGDPVNTPFRRGSYPFSVADVLSTTIVVP
jgi:hypothetical protein